MTKIPITPGQVWFLEGRNLTIDQLVKGTGGLSVWLGVWSTGEKQAFSDRYLQKNLSRRMLVIGGIAWRDWPLPDVKQPERKKLARRPSKA